ncbi:unnamed protein product, partial [Ectocarpus sp. 12 AP-2014]
MLMRCMAGTVLLAGARTLAFRPPSTIWGVKVAGQAAMRRQVGSPVRSSSTMKLKTGIVGMPNVGKSTLFNAVTEAQGAMCANYPFATIEPNIGVVEVPDGRLKVLAEINKSVKTVPSTLDFYDIAGLVKVKMRQTRGTGLG